MCCQDDVSGNRGAPLPAKWGTGGELWHSKVEVVKLRRLSDFKGPVEGNRLEDRFSYGKWSGKDGLHSSRKIFYKF